MIKSQALRILVYTALILIIVVCLFGGLVYGRSFLLPLAMAALLSMIILPVSRWLERKGMARGWAAFLSDVVIILFFVILAGVVAAQVNNLTDQWPQIKQQIEPRINQLERFITQQTGISAAQQQQRLPDFLNQPNSSQSSSSDSPQSNQSNGDSTQAQQSSSSQSAQSSQSSGGGASSSSGGSVLSSLGSVLSQFFATFGNFLLVLVYTFFFLLYRKKFKKSILKMVPPDRQERTEEVVADATQVAQNYLFGRMLLILFLAGLYAIGLSISGVQNAILVSLLAAVLSLLPYVGNIIGYSVAVTLAFVSGGGAASVIGVSITFAITQFVESYVLEPYVVGDKVNLNPVFTIIAVVLGGAVWGVVGMLIAIPFLAIAKVIFDHVPALQPLGYLLGEEDTKDDDQGDDNSFEKVKQWVEEKFHA